MDQDQTPTEPGWYDDPQGGSRYQMYWNGNMWTEIRSTPERAGRQAGAAGGTLGVILLVMLIGVGLAGGGKGRGTGCSSLCSCSSEFWLRFRPQSSGCSCRNELAGSRRSQVPRPVLWPVAPSITSGNMLAFRSPISFVMCGLGRLWLWEMARRLNRH
jgi:hypothetical protein